MPERISPDEPIRVLVIGAGRMAGEHVRAFQACADATVVAVASASGTSAERLAGELGVPQAGADWAQLAAETSAHACVVATSHDATAPIAGEAMSMGLDTLVEKPVALDPVTVRALAAQADRAGRLAMVGMNRRFFRSVLAAIDIVRYHGPVIGVHVDAPDPVQPKRATGTYAEDVWDNWTIANTLHAIDLLRVAAGSEVREVTGTTRTWDGESSRVAMLAFENGATGTYVSHGASGGPWRLRINGRHAEAVLDPLEYGTIRVGASEEALPHDDEGLKYGTLGQAEAFLAAIRTGSLAPPASDLADHARSIELALQLQDLPVSDDE